MTWHMQFNFTLDKKWVATEIDGDDLSEGMRKAEQQAFDVLGGTPLLVRMVASRLKER